MSALAWLLVAEFSPGLTFLVTITFDYLGTLTLGTYLLRLHVREV
jgi:hypothetical protein